ncbi:DNA polymerase-3 subunit delta' [Ereboglobus sp. PH5-10]|uniref:DNA polymerase III subunit delta' n=1 Tax=Ereboglobus sp. PH5-10 TaxID=2940629 RepID=UPI002407565C|nr:DNA polymerase III subunit delta' [Ereboglobus sp. PH5-10]MDF9827402.1 DNA polymerase-3 subunit delta' [Ereboglobus sp. PH5-10]
MSDVIAPKTQWPAALADSPSIAVIEQAIQTGRLSHSLLLSGDDIEILASIADCTADRILNTHASSAYFAPANHPDCFTLRPAGKVRQIGADATRALIGKVQVSPNVSVKKTAIIYECDRMNPASANIFLKTLEEPPANTTIILLTTRPYSLLPTIRSRCLNFRFPSIPAAYSPDGWGAWLADYKAWLARLAGPKMERRDVADSIFTVYGLVSRFGVILEFATDEIWKKQKENLPADIGEAEQIAIETGIANDLRTRLFIEIEQATRDFAVPAIVAENPKASRALTEAVAKLEHATGLLRVNMNESAALESFLLSSLRIWTTAR